MRLGALVAPAVVLGAAAAAREVLARRSAIDLDGQVVLITGGSRGLGFAMASEFARRGARIAICARTDDQLERARLLLSEQGADVFAHPCDVSDNAQATELIER